MEVRGGIEHKEQQRERQRERMREIWMLRERERELCAVDVG